MKKEKVHNTTEKKAYDIIYSLGPRCATAEFMNSAKLREVAGPFDWTGIGTFQERFQLINNGFKDFFEKAEDFEIYEDGDPDPYDLHYRNKKTGFLFFHDFPKKSDKETIFPKLKEKYDRRIKRFYKNIRTKKRVLLIWCSVLGEEHTEDSVLLEYCDKICKFFDKEIDFLIIENSDGLMQPRKTQISPNITRYYLHTKYIEGSKSPIWLGNFDLILPIFQQYKLYIPPYIRFRRTVLTFLSEFICIFIPVKKWRRNIRKFARR